MKITIALVLVFMAKAIFAMSQSWYVEIYSKKCGKDFIKGTKVELPGGERLWRCMHRNFLPDVYEADVDVKCGPNHTSSNWFYSSNHLHYKYCVLTEQLGPDYPTLQKSKCADGYESTQEVIYTDVLFDHKLCEKVAE